MWFVGAHVSSRAPALAAVLLGDVESEDGAEGGVALSPSAVGAVVLGMASALSRPSSSGSFLWPVARTLCGARPAECAEGCTRRSFPARPTAQAAAVRAVARGRGGLQQAALGGGGRHAHAGHVRHGAELGHARRSRGRRRRALGSAHGAARPGELQRGAFPAQPVRRGQARDAGARRLHARAAAPRACDRGRGGRGAVPRRAGGDERAARQGGSRAVGAGGGGRAPDGVLPVGRAGHSAAHRGEHAQTQLPRVDGHGDDVGLDAGCNGGGRGGRALRADLHHGALQGERELPAGGHV